MAKLKDAALQFSKRSGTIIITGQDIQLPDALKPISAKIKLSSPQIEEYKELLFRIIRDMYPKMEVKMEMTDGDISRLLSNMKGLTLTEAEKVLTRIIVEDGKLSPEDIRRVIEAKKDIVGREGLLEYHPVEEGMTDIADFQV